MGFCQGFTPIFLLCFFKFRFFLQIFADFAQSKQNIYILPLIFCRNLCIMRVD